jgi:hypothetical protein
MRPKPNFLRIATALVGLFACTAAFGQTSNNVRDLTFTNSQHPRILIDMNQPIVYLEDGSVELTCVPLSSDPTKCFGNVVVDPRSPRVTLTSSSLPIAPGTTDVYQVSSGQSFVVFRSVTNSAEVCVPTVEGVATVTGWNNTTGGSASGPVSITVASTRDISLAVKCYNQYGATSEPTRRTYRVVR